MKATYQTDMTDLTPEALAARAKDVLAQYQRESGLTPEVIAKWTCPKCRERVFAPSVNVLRPTEKPLLIDCENCGKMSPFLRGGFSLRIATEKAAEALAFLGAIGKTDSKPERVIVQTVQDGGKKVSAEAGSVERVELFLLGIIATCAAVGLWVLIRAGEMIR